MNYRLLMSRYENLLGEKGEKLTLMERAAQFFEPNDALLCGGAFVIDAVGSQYRELLDTTGIEVVDEYVNSALGLTYNQSKRWFRIEHSDIAFDSDNQKILDRRAEIMFKNIARTNYYEQIDTHERDIVGNGHGLFIINKDKKNFASCYSKDPYHVVFTQDEQNRVLETYWKSWYGLVDLLVAFPSLKDRMLTEFSEISSPESTMNYTVIHCLLPLTELFIMDEKDQEMADAGYKYVLKYIFRDHGNLFVEKSIDPKDYVDDVLYIREPKYFKNRVAFPARDKIVRNQPYGLGIYRDILPKSRILNSLQGSILEMVQHQGNPPIVMDAEIYAESGGNVKAGKVFIRKHDTLSSSSVRNAGVELLQTKGDIAAVDAIHQKHQEQLVGRLPTANNIYKVARQSVEEINQRLQQQEKKLAPIRATYIKEGLSNHLRRFYQLCEEDGLFNVDGARLPEDVDIDISPDSEKLIFDPFVLDKHRENRASALIRFLSALSTVAAAIPSAIQWLNGDKIIKTIASGFGVFDHLKQDQQVLDERENQLDVAERREQRADGQAAAENAKAAAGIGSLLSTIIGKDAK